MNGLSLASDRFDRFRLVGSAVVVMWASAASLRAQSLVFPNFSSTSGLTITSAATAATGDGTVLHLADNSHNDRGSVFTTAMRSVSGFSTAFQFRLSNPAGISDGIAVGADGFVFVVQRAANNSLGSNGEGLGYLGIGSSVGVEFDTFLNASRSDPSSNHIGIDTLGSVTSLATANVSPDFDNGSLWTAWIDYDGTTLEVRVSTGVRPGASMLSYALNLSSTIGGSMAYVGFTASTGGAWADHDLIKWTFSDNYIAGGVSPGSAIPEPSTYAGIAGMLALAVAGAMRVRSRRKSAGSSNA